MTALSLEQAPWRGLLRVQTELGERCTGFLIAPSIAITAAHCLFTARSGRFLQPGSVHVLLGYRFGHFRAHARVRQFIISPGYDPRREARSAGLDRAVLLLDQPIAPLRDLVPISGKVPEPGSALRLGGYGQDREEAPFEGPACRVTALLRDQTGHVLIAHDCAGTRGTSGAPLLARAPDGTWQAVGVQIAARLGDAAGLAAVIPTGTASGR